MYWNHRVMKNVPDPKHPDYEEYSIREVFYNDEDGSIIGWTEGEEVWGESVESMRQTLEWMMGALDKPVLDEKALLDECERLKEMGADVHDVGVNPDGTEVL